MSVNTDPMKFSFNSNFYWKLLYSPKLESFKCIAQMKNYCDVLFSLVIDIYIQTHTYVYTHIYTYIYIHTYINAYTHTNTHTYTHKYVYIYIDGYTYIHIYREREEKNNP